MRQVRLRLAACRLIQQDETSSDLPGGRWKVSPTRHVSVCFRLLVPLFFFQTNLFILFFLYLKTFSPAAQQINNFHVLRPGEDVLEEEEQEKTDAPLFSGHHECPLVQQKVTESPACNGALIHDVIHTCRP